MHNLKEPPLAVAPTSAARPLAALYRWLLLGAVLLLVASFYQRVLHGDEAWIGEQAYWAAREGIVRSELFRGFLHAEVRQWVYHWLFVWQAAGVIRVVGWSVVSLKLISLAYLAVFLLISYHHLRQYYFIAPAGLALFYALLLLNALVVEYSFVFRPEIMLMCLGFGSWILLERSVHLPTRRLGYAALAALLAGLAALTHFNGLIFIVAGTGLLLLRRRLRAAVLFGGVASLVFGLGFVDVLVHDAWAEYFRQLAPAIKQEPHQALPFLRQLFTEQKRFFHSPLEAVLALLVLAAGVVLGLHRRQWSAPRFTDAVWYLLLLITALACLAPGKTTKYLVLYMPHLCLVVTTAFIRVGSRPVWQFRLLASLLVLYVGVNVAYTGYLISRHENRVTKNRALAHQLAAYRHSRIVAPLELVFNQIDQFTIQGVPCYSMLLDTGRLPADGTALFTEAARFRRQLIILNDNSLKDLNLPKPVAGRIYGRYRYAYQFQDYYIYKAL